MEWSAVVLTCPNSNYTSAYQKELERRRCNDFLNKETTLIVVEDPKSQIGSGGATLNALLVLAEHISAKKGFSVINSDVLEGGRILLIHSGRTMPYEPCGRPFVNLVLSQKDPHVVKDGTSQSFCLLDLIIKLMSTKIALNSPAGVWVCSSDMLLLVEDTIDSECFCGADACLLMVPSSEDYAKQHGICELDEGTGYLKNIHYKCDDRDTITNCTLPTGFVPLVSGVVYLSLAVANTLLALHTISPLDACTYLGCDSGIAPIQLSLFFDFLLAMCPGCTEDKFVAGGIYGDRKDTSANQPMSEHKRVLPDLTAFARKVVFKHFSSFKCKTILVEGSHNYLTWHGHEYITQVLHPHSQYEGLALKIELRRHLHMEDVIVGDGVGLLNCSLAGGINVGSRSLLQNVSLSGNNITLGKNCILSSIMMKNASKLSLDENSALVGFLIGQKKKRRRCLVVLGCQDELMGISTFCNIPFEEFKKRTGITDTDLWIESEPRSIYSARLFPVSSCSSYSTGDDDFIEFVHFLQARMCDLDVLMRWKNSDRVSLEDIFSDLDVEGQMEFKRSIFHRVSCQIIWKTLVCNQPLRLQGLYFVACSEGRGQRLLEELDKIGQDNHSCPGISARVLANIANLLGEMANGEGGLRSGPASNKCWTGAYRLLEKGDVIGGLKMMSQERNNWLDSKIRLVRAARHYEGACQILIRQAVMSVHKFIKTKPGDLPAIHRWVNCHCPARIDIAGGWSDTPPLTYESGGAVFNAAITVNGSKPIGAQARRITNLELVIHLEGGIQIVGDDLDFLTNYNQPSAAGSLIKACLICSGLVEYPSQTSLCEQLRSKFGSGFEIKSWSKLPHGSGLGTSSIMAGAILACLWKAAGYSVDIHSLNHAVLYVEQLLTTGGGWQDQVGGLCRGVKLGHSRSNLPLEIEVDHVTVSKEVLQLFNSHLVLIYTGQTRLAKNLLQNVIRNWYSRDEEVIGVIEDLVSLAHLSRKSFEHGDLVQLGRCITRYWQLKKALAPGSEPRAVTQVMEALRDRCHGMCMAGAGGGGFMYILTKEKKDEENIRRILSELKIENHPQVYEACVDEEGMTLQVEGQPQENISFKLL